MTDQIQTVGAGQSGDNDTLDDTGVTLHDTGAAFVTRGVKIGETVNNTSDGSSGIITSITDNTHVVMSAGLSGGTDDEWQATDTYTIPRDQATLALWETDTQSPTSGDTEIGECYNDADFLNESFTLNATGTNATTNRVVRAAFLQGHDGTRAGAGVTLLATAGVHAFTVLEKFGTFGEGMLVELQAGQGSSQECFRIGNGSENAEGTTIDSAILYNNGSQTSTDGIYAGNYDVGTSANPIRVVNVFVSGFVRGGIHMQNFGSTSDTHHWEIINCTSVDNKWNVGFDVRVAGSTINVVAINNILGDHSPAQGDDWGSTHDDEFGTVDTSGSANNFSEDNSAPAQTQFTLEEAENSGSFEILVASTTTPYNILLVASPDNDGMLAGVGNGSNSLVPTVDFIGNNRGIGATCDPGCHQVSITLSPAPLVIPVLVAAPEVGADITVAPAALAIPILVPTVTLTGLGRTIAPAALALPLVLPGVSLDMGTRTVDPPALTVPVVLPTHDLDMGTLALDPPPLTVPVVLPTHDLDMGTTAVTPAALAVPLVLPGVDLDMGTLTVDPAPLTVPLVLPGASLDMGTKTIDPAAIAIPIVVPTVNVGAGLFIQPAALAVPIVLPGLSLDMGTRSVVPAALSVPLVLPVPALDMGTLTMDPAALAVPIVLPGSTLTLGTKTIDPAALAVPLVLPGVSLNMGTRTVIPAAIPIPIVVPAPSVGTAVVIQPAALQIPLVLPGAFLDMGTRPVTPAALAVPLVLPGVTLDLGTIAIAPAALSIPVLLVAPSISQTLTLSPAALAVPIILPGAALNMGTRDVSPAALSVPILVVAITVVIPGTFQLLIDRGTLFLPTTRIRTLFIL